MRKYCRVVWSEEKEAIDETGRIPTNHQRWECYDETAYEPGTVVMLWDLGKVFGDFLDSWIGGQVQDIGGCYRLDFEADIETEVDKSGWGEIGAVVHRGEIDLEDIDIISFAKL